MMSCSIAILSLLVQVSIQEDIDPRIPIAIAMVESGCNPKIEPGNHGEIGLMQIRPKFIKEKHLLHSVKGNINLGIKRLIENRQRCHHKDDFTWILCYNYGYTGVKKVKFPKKTNYYKKFISYYRSLKLTKQYEVDDEVVVLQAFADGTNGLGKITKVLNDGLYRVKLGLSPNSEQIEVSEERLINRSEYHEKNHNKLLFKNMKNQLIITKDE